MQQNLEQLLTDPRASAATVGATVGSGWANWFDLANHNVTLIATWVGIALSLLMIVLHVRKEIREVKEHRIRMLKLEQEIQQKAK